MSVLCLSEALFLASRFVKSDACIACMDLHEKTCTPFPRSGHAGRGPARIMHMHEKRCIKRAGVAGIALRAKEIYQFILKQIGIVLDNKPENHMA